MRIREQIVRNPRVGLSRALKRVLGDPDYESLRAAGVTIGEHVSIANGCLIDKEFGYAITIKDRVTFAPKVMIFSHDAMTRTYVGYTRVAPILIEEGASIGAGAIILPGVTIGKDSIVGAGSVVSMDVPAGSVMGGSPLRHLSTIEEVKARREARRTDQTTFSNYRNRTAADIERFSAALREHGEIWIR